MVLLVQVEVVKKLERSKGRVISGADFYESLQFLWHVVNLFLTCAKKSLHPGN
jgi:hypothetical protein